MNNTKIEWAVKTWNPITGCSKISEGCQNCYAERMSKRLAGRFGYLKHNPFAVTIHNEKLSEPLKMKKQTRIFVCSMGDLFHEQVPMIEILKVFDIMNQCPQHIFMVITKRPGKMLKFAQKYGFIPDGNGFTGSGGVWPSNVWAGVTSENQQRADDRIPVLLQVPAMVRFVSCEPLLGPIRFKKDTGSIEGGEYHTHNFLTGISEGCDGFECSHYHNGNLDWVIVGGETGIGARPSHPDWVRSIRNQCQSANIPFLFKSWGSWKTVYDRDRDDPDWRNCPNDEKDGGRYLNLHGGRGFHNERVIFVKNVGKKISGRLLDGRIWDEIPSQHSAS